MKVLIDGDIVAYRCCFAAEHTRYQMKYGKKTKWFDSKTEVNQFLKEHPEIADYELESTLEVEPLNYVLSTIKHMVANILEEVKPYDSYVIYLSGENNFRKDVGTVAKYKGNRDKKRKPHYLSEALKYLRKNYVVDEDDRLEADDLLADAQRNALARGEKTVIASIDKDLLQIPGLHYNFVSGAKVKMTEDTAHYNLMAQMLMGDATDNIPGIKGIGPKTAEKLLRDLSPEGREDQVERTWAEHLVINTPDWVEGLDNTGDELVITYTVHDGDIPESMTLTQFLAQLRTLLTVGGHDGETHKAAEV